MALDLGINERKAQTLWPNLVEGAFERTSDEDSDYNCVAWAMRDKTRWWQPTGKPYHYWPNKAIPIGTLDGYRQAFSTRHYADCDDGSLEVGMEKIAIYAKDGEFTHVARQLPDGRWTSKLGQVKDITHSLDALTGGNYGEVVGFMRRPRMAQQAQQKRSRKRHRR